ncbi:MAG: STAS domain-containing protein [Lachnospiraceae bacterium]|nr:STAS domain-containing protein [Lachnospiraceae bacterium]
MLNISKNVEDEKALFTLEGRLDTLTAADLEEQIRDSLEGVTELTLDLEKLEYISSAGLRVLLSAWKMMDAKQGGMKLVRVNETVMETLEITHFSEILNIETAF